MRHTRAWALAVSGLMLALTTSPGCTKATLYRPGFEPDAPNKLTLSGRICTEDYQRRNFPVKIAFVIDSGPDITSNDAAGSRALQVQQIVTRFANDNYEYAFIRWAGDTDDPTLLNDFTADPSFIMQGVAAFNANIGCQTGPGLGGAGCRDYLGAVSRVTSLISGDVLEATIGLVARTKYVVVFLANGPPEPPPCTGSTIMNCNDGTLMRDRVEALREFVLDNGAVDLVFHTVYVDNCNRSVAANDAGAAILQEMAFAGAGSFARIGIPHQCYAGDVDATGAPIDDDGDGLANVNDPDCNNTGCNNGVCDYNETDTGCPADCNITTCGNGACDMNENVAVCPLDCFVDPVPGCGFFEDGTMGILDTGITFANLDLEPASSPFVKRSFIVSNANVIPDQDGILIDSDTDGLSDETELLIGTDPTLRDTDGDGISDLVELYYETLGFRLNDPTMPDRPIDCLGDPPFDDMDGDGFDDDREDDIGTSFSTPDTDGDGLWDCEERVVGTEPTLFDSDADGVPDWLELRAGTIPVFADQNLDTDLDGMNNGDEITLHADPLAYDVLNQLEFNYRYTVTDEGLNSAPFIEQPSFVTGVLVEAMSSDTRIGVGSLIWDVAAGTLSWTEQGDLVGGTPVPINGDGVYTLHSGSSCTLAGTCDCNLANPDPAECECRVPPPGMVCAVDEVFDNFTGECCKSGLERWLRVRVQEVLLPPGNEIDLLSVGETERNCIVFRVRNVTLVETLLDPFSGNLGMNSIYVFFGQVPVERPLSYPLFRVALVRAQFLEATADMAPFRDPEEGEVVLVDDDFVLFEF